MTIKMWDLGSNLSWKDGVGSTERITQSSLNFSLHLMNGSMFVKKTKTKKRTFVGFITYSSEWKHFHWHWKFLLSYRPFFVALFFPIGLNIPLLFFANLFLLFYELKSIKNANYRIAKKIGNSFRFTNDLLAINDGNEFENLPMWTCFDTETFNETTKTETS